MKKIVAALLFVIVFLGVSEALELIKVVVGETEGSVVLRSQPNNKGEILGEFEDNSAFLVDPQVIENKNDKSAWYKVIFIISEYDGSIIQTDKLSEYHFSHPYVNAGFAKKELLSEEEEGALEWFNQGRPTNIKIGDDLSEYYADANECTLKADIVLLREPKEDAEKIIVKEGTKIYLHYDTSMDTYTDMNEVSWIFVVGGKGKKFLGWRLVKDEIPIDPL